MEANNTFKAINPLYKENYGDKNKTYQFKNNDGKASMKQEGFKFKKLKSKYLTKGK